MRSVVPLALVLVAAASSAACKKSSSSSSSSSSSNDGGTASSAEAVSAPGQAAPLQPGFEGSITMHVTNVHAAAPTDVTFLAKGTKLRVDVPGHTNEQAHVIFDSTEQKTFVILDSQRMYLETDHQLAQRVPGPRPLPAQITQTGKHETVAGTDCEDWEIVEPLGKHANVCVAQGVAFFDFSATRPVGGVPQRGWMDELRMKQTFPLRSVETDSTGKELSRMEVTKIEKKSLDDALFTVPAGYKAMATVRPGDFPIPAKPR